MKNTRSELTSRYADASWLKDCNIVLVGLGAVGQGVGLSLLANGYEVHAYDNDTVNLHNCIPQGYSLDQVGLNKTTAFLQNAMNFIGIQPVLYTKLYDDFTGEVMISAVDNMVGRKQIFDAFLNDEDSKLFVDTRMIPSQFQVYCITKDEEKIKLYQNSLFDDKDIPEQACSFKSSRHTNQIIHGYITSMVCNYVVNRELGIDAFELPAYYSFNSNYISLCGSQ